MSSNGYRVRDGIIYVQGSVEVEVDGEIKRVFKRYSTGKSDTKLNIAWIKKNHRDVLLKKVSVKSSKKVEEKVLEVEFEPFARRVIEVGSRKRSERTQSEYVAILDNHILPKFGKSKFRMKPLEIEEWQNELLDRLSTSRVKRIRNVLQLILKKAAANGLIKNNPFNNNDVESITVKYEDNINEPYTQSEVQLLTARAEGWIKTFLVLAFSTGMRTGELMALKWSDIQWDEDYIIVQRSITKGVVGTTKSKKSRNVDLFADAKNQLRELYHESESVYVFVNGENNPFSYSTSITKTYFKPLIEKCGIKFRTLYSTRHTFASVMLANGFDIYWVSRMLGHQDIKVTYQHYAKYIPTKKRDNERMQAANSVLFKSVKIAK